MPAPQSSPLQRSDKPREESKVNMFEMPRPETNSHGNIVKERYPLAIIDNNDTKPKDLIVGSGLERHGLPIAF